MADNHSDPSLNYWQPKKEINSSQSVYSNLKLKHNIEKMLGHQQKLELAKKKREKQAGSTDLTGGLKAGKKSALNPYLSEISMNRTLGELSLSNRIIKRPDLQRTSKPFGGQPRSANLPSGVGCNFETLLMSKIPSESSKNEYQTGSANTLAAKSKRRNNNSISSVNYKGDPQRDTPLGMTKSPVQHKSLEHRLKVFYIDTNEAEEGGSPIKLRSRDESSRERAQINELINKRLESSSNLLLRNEDNQAYIKRVKQVLKGSMMPGTPTKHVMSAPDNKMPLSSKSQKNSPELSASKFLEATVSDWGLKPQRPKNRSLDTRDVSPKVGNLHKRQISFNKANEMAEERFKNKPEEKFNEKNSLLKCFLEVLKIKPHDLLTNDRSNKDNTPLSINDEGARIDTGVKGDKRMFFDTLRATAKVGVSKDIKAMNLNNPAQSKNQIKSSIPSSCRADNNYRSLFQSLLQKGIPKNSVRAPSSYVSGVQGSFLARQQAVDNVNKVRVPNAASTGESSSAADLKDKLVARNSPQRIKQTADNTSGLNEANKALLKIDRRQAAILSMNALDSLSLPRNLARTEQIYQGYLRSQDVYELVRWYFNSCQTQGVLVLEVIYGLPASLD